MAFSGWLWAELQHAITYQYVWVPYWNMATRLLFFLVTGAILSPALAWLLDQLIRSTGDYAISNYDLVSFFLSFKGLTFLAGSAATSLALLYVELTGLLLITADPDLPVRAVPALRHALSRFGRLLRMGLLQVVGLALAAAPFLAGIGVVKLTLLGAHDINYYLHLQPPEWTRAMLISGGLAVVGAIYGAAAVSGGGEPEAVLLPAPTPKNVRPGAKALIVAIAAAFTGAGRVPETATPVPSWIRDVRSAASASVA